MNTIIFAKNILYNPLCEYVHSTPWPVHWVNEYSLELCLNIVAKSKCEHAIFLQRGPIGDLFGHLLKNNILVSILNTEQMTRFIANTAGEEVFFPFGPFLTAYIQTGQLHSILDYSQENIKIWKTCFPDLRTSLACFTGYSSPIDYKKNQDVVFVGDQNSSYRQTILKVVSPTIVSQIYGHKRDAIVFAHRMLLNVHFGTSYTIFEELRCLPCVFNQMIVVSEESKFDVEHPLHKFIIFAPYADLAKVVAHTLANYKSVFDALFVDNPHFVTLHEDITKYNERLCIK